MVTDRRAVHPEKADDAMRIIIMMMIIIIIMIMMIVIIMMIMMIVIIKMIMMRKLISNNCLGDNHNHVDNDATYMRNAIIKYNTGLTTTRSAWA